MSGFLHSALSVSLLDMTVISNLRRLNPRNLDPNNLAKNSGFLRPRRVPLLNLFQALMTNLLHNLLLNLCTQQQGQNLARQDPVVDHTTKEPSIVASTPYQSPHPTHSDDDGGWKVVTRRKDRGKRVILAGRKSRQLTEIREEGVIVEIDPGGNPYLS